ncbi:cell shape-determining protein MreB [Reichenbachiella agariperforans]|uniref:cell shape-determining protein MreB n=1 Tax=Reichenbachiella agariperforans TaxID=156994 RepID=UPI001C0A4014|nr:cell shape-determining protein MreB [Reichenbachiella agariperforans]MBU2915108.1 cell shape-determining protein MreB [Reichenbachiella agariperforans]
MKTFKFNQLVLGLGVLVAVATTSCQDQLLDSPQPDFKGSAAAAPQVTLSGVLSNRTLDRDTVYILDEFVRVPSGVTLTIESGTLIKGETGTLSGNPATGTPPGTLVIERGGKIEATGTSTAPIVFTSNETTPASGDWGGVIILGKAPVCFDGTTAIEGIPTSASGDNGYGGVNDADNSGTLQYVRIEYAGNVLVDGDEINGLTLGGVGSGTTIDHVQVTHGLDDGFEFFGGTVNASYLIASFNKDDDFDTDQGYSGHIQFGVSLRDPSVFSSLPTGGFESNGDNDDASGCSFTNATFSNFTVIGPIGPNSSSAVNVAYNSGVLIRDGSELNLFNSIITGYPNYQLELETIADFDNDDNSTTDDVVSVEGVTLVYPTFSPFNAQGTNVGIFDFAFIANYHNESSNATNTGAGTSLTDLTGLSASAWNLTAPNFVPDTEKPSDFSHNLLSGCVSVDFRGAFGKDGDAIEGTNWDLGWEQF